MPTITKDNYKKSDFKSGYKLSREWHKDRGLIESEMINQYKNETMVDGENYKLIYKMTNIRRATAKLAERLRVHPLGLAQFKKILEQKEKQDEI